MKVLTLNIFCVEHKQLYLQLPKSYIGDFASVSKQKKCKQELKWDLADVGTLRLAVAVQHE